MNIDFICRTHITLQGQIETHVRTVAMQLGKLCTENPDQWPSLLRTIQNAHNTMTNSATEFSPHFLVYGREMTDHLQRLCEVESELGVVDSFQDIVRQIITSRDLALKTLNETHKGVFTKNGRQLQQET